MARFKRDLNHLLQNVRAGAQLALFRRAALARLRVSIDQVVYLVALDIVIMLALSWVDALPSPDFNLWGISSTAFGFTTLLAIGYLLARLFRKKELIVRFVIGVYSISPWFTLIGYFMKKGYAWAPLPWAVGLLWWASILWFLAVVGWLMLHLAGKRDWRLAVTLTSFIAIILSSSSLHVEFFYPGEPLEDQSSYRRLNAEDIFDAQPELLQNAVRGLQAGHPGVPELYFLGFASYAGQDVFRKETLYARELLDRRFGTRGHSLVMINHADTASKLPLASAANLRRILKFFARRMNTREDVLFVYLTSHGSEKRGLAAQFWPLALNDIPAEKLKAYLDEAGIQWRVLLVSACYSGHFADVLKDDHTLVMTASAVDKQSFGCSNARDFTYFGEAVFKDALQRERHFIPAFQGAIAAITRREADEKLTPSSPQIFIGSKIAAKLADIERRLGPVKMATAGSDTAVKRDVASQ